MVPRISVPVGWRASIPAPGNPGAGSTLPHGEAHPIAGIQQGALSLIASVFAGLEPGQVG